MGQNPSKELEELTNNTNCKVDMGGAWIFIDFIPHRSHRG